MLKKKTTLQKFKASIKPDSLGRVKGYDTLTHRRMRAKPGTKGFSAFDCVSLNSAEKIETIPVKKS